jgi:hypothetical protein
MGRCAGITLAGGSCKGTPIDGSGWCYVHDPDHAEERRRHGSRGGKRGGRGRPTSELARLGQRFENLADMALSGKVERADAAVAGQLLNGARACVRDGLAAKEQEQLIERLEALEAGLEQRPEQRNGGGYVQF